MTQFAQKSFTVSQRGRDAATCGHGWRNAKGVCVFCGDGSVLYREMETPRRFDHGRYEEAQ